MQYIDIIGYLAGFLVLISLIPQIIKSYKTKKTNDLSIFRYLIYFLGITLWLIYSIIIFNGPMILSNTIALFLASMILVLKMKYG